MALRVKLVPLLVTEHPNVARPPVALSGSLVQFSTAPFGPVYHWLSTQLFCQMVPLVVTSGAW